MFVGLKSEGGREGKEGKGREMSAEVVGRDLLGEVKEEGLDEVSLIYMVFCINYQIIGFSFFHFFLSLFHFLNTG